MGFEVDSATGDGASPTVLCPQGHLNAWNYKFCGQCGAPIGVMAWPPDGDAVVTPGSPSRRRRFLLAGAIALAGVTAAAAVVVGVLMTGSPSEDETTTQGRGGFGTGATAAPAVLTPPCVEAPLVEAESVSLTPEGLAVSAAFMSRCSGGNTESSSEVRITVADGQRDIAAAVFNFSSEPMAMEPGVTARRTLVFTPGTYWRTPEMFSGAPEMVFHPGGRSEPGAVAAATDKMVAQGPAKPEHGSADGVAEAVLNEIRDSDYQYVTGSIANRWVPQISSKKAGLVVDGKTFTSTDVLRDHLDMRTKYKGARLVWSGQWSTFNSPDWWITVVGPPTLTATEANRWCDNEDFGVDDCFAKFVSSIFGVEGTVEYRK